MFTIKLMYVSFCLLAVQLTLSQVTSEKCNCVCSHSNSKDICQIVDHLTEQYDSIFFELQEIAKIKRVVANLKDYDILSLKNDIEELKEKMAQKEFLPSPESLILKPEEEGKTAEMSPEDRQLVKNVSNLLAKVEEVENLTMEVQEELKSERRVRRHLEVDLNETRSSISVLGQRLQNVTAPVDIRVAQVEEVVFSTLESLNRTLFENHLQKLYYRVDGVAYKNETKMFDERLGVLENELQDAYNGSKIWSFLQEISAVGESVRSLNASIEETLEDLFSQQHAQSVQLLELKDRMKDLAGDVHTFRNTLENMTNSIQEIQYTQIDLQNSTTEGMKFMMNLKARIEYLELNDANNETQHRKVDSSESELHDTDLETEDTSSLTTDSYKEYELITQANDSLNGTNDIVSETVTVREVMENIKDKDTYINEFFEDYFNPEDSEMATSTELQVTEQNRMEKADDKAIMSGGLLEKKPVGDFCKLSLSDETHILMTLKRNAKGGQSLVLSCRPIGQYIISHEIPPIDCENGSWNGPLPRCIRLLNESEIEAIAKDVEEENPCLAGPGEYPDPMDCSRFFKCWHGQSKSLPCPPGLVFSPTRKVCDYASNVDCLSHKAKSNVLKDIIPPILISPKNLDKPNSLLGSGNEGELIVYPQSSFSLHCLFPENPWGKPSWSVRFADDFEATLSNTRDKINEVSITITSTKEADSGIYTCRTPFGREHSIKVVVKAVQCPPLTEDDDGTFVFYRPNPEGDQRALGTTAIFQCTEGHSISAVCMANGQWSRLAPTEDECTIKRSDSGSSTWKCPPIYTRHRPELILERDEEAQVVLFRCTGRMRLEGNSFTRCREDGTWTHQTLPKCTRRFY